MSTCRVVLDQPVDGYHIYDLVDVSNADAAFDQAQQQFGGVEIVSATEFTDPTADYKVNGTWIVGPAVAYPYNGPPHPQTALDDSLQPTIDQDELDLCADLIHAVGPDLMFTSGAFTDGERDAVTDRFERRRQRRTAHVHLRPTGDPA